MRLRGYDDYVITLGDEMRGHRASLGKTLLDAEGSLRIKADILRAIEDCDLDGFPNDSVIPGYVRSYARYLGIDAEDAYRRFCIESGFRSPATMLGPVQDAQRNSAAAVASGLAAVGTSLANSRFAVPPAPARMRAHVSLGGLASALALVGLVAGLGYGGYALLQDIQRVGFAPLPAAPEVVAEAPLIAAPSVDGSLVRRPDAGVYQGDGVLAAIAPAEMLPPILPARDGPISAIDPGSSGAFAGFAPEVPVEPVAAVADARVETVPAPRVETEADPAAMPIPREPGSGMPGQVTIHAVDTAWIRVNDGESAVVFEGTLAAGQTYDVPDRVAMPLLRAGNAGAVFLMVGGVPYGPLGNSGSVIKNLSLRADDIEARLPQAAAVAPSGDEPRAAALTVRQ